MKQGLKLSRTSRDNLKSRDIFMRVCYVKQLQQLQYQKIFRAIKRSGELYNTMADLDNLYYISQNLGKQMIKRDWKHGSAQSFTQPHKILCGLVFSHTFSKIDFQNFHRRENMQSRNILLGAYLLHILRFSIFFTMKYGIKHSDLYLS